MSVAKGRFIRVPLRPLIEGGMKAREVSLSNMQLAELIGDTLDYAQEAFHAQAFCACADCNKPVLYREDGAKYVLMMLRASYRTHGSMFVFALCPACEPANERRIGRSFAMEHAAPRGWALIDDPALDVVVRKKHAAWEAVQ